MGGQLTVYSGTSDVMLCQFSEELPTDNSECVSNWPVISIAYKHGNEDGELMADIIEVIAAFKVLNRLFCYQVQCVVVAPVNHLALFKIL